MDYQKKASAIRPRIQVTMETGVQEMRFKAQEEADFMVLKKG
jgi:hypothetical protein